jgi:tetratricopeptide (TPR) repeat protein
MKRILLFWTFFFIGSYFSICQEISEEAKRYYDRGITALEMIESEQYSNYDDAIKEFNKVKELAPKFKDVYLKLGQIYLKLKKYQEAANNYKEYLQLETDAKKVSEIKTLMTSDN